MQIDNLQKRSYDVNASDLTTTYLVPSSVSYKHYERAMILLDIVIDQNRYARVELFAHAVDRDKNDRNLSIQCNRENPRPKRERESNRDERAQDQVAHCGVAEVQVDAHQKVSGTNTCPDRSIERLP